MNQLANFTSAKKPVERDIVEHVKNARPRQYWADVINAKWQEQVPTIIETGLRLEEANAELPPKEWKTLLKDDLNITKGTASKLIAISQSDNIAEVSYRKLLPASWTTLYILTCITDDDFAAAAADGRIHPKMQQKDAVALRGKKPVKLKKPAAPSKISAIDRCAMKVRETILSAIDEVAPDQWAALLADLHNEFADIARVVEERQKETGE